SVDPIVTEVLCMCLSLHPSDSTHTPSKTVQGTTPTAFHRFARSWIEPFPTVIARSHASAWRRSNRSLRSPSPSTACGKSPVCYVCTPPALPAAQYVDLLAQTEL